MLLTSVGLLRLLWWHVRLSKALRDHFHLLLHVIYQNYHHNNECNSQSDTDRNAGNGPTFGFTGVATDQLFVSFPVYCVIGLQWIE